MVRQKTRQHNAGVSPGNHQRAQQAPQTQFQADWKRCNAIASRGKRTILCWLS